MPLWLVRHNPTRGGKGPSRINLSENPLPTIQAQRCTIGDFTDTYYWLECGEDEFLGRYDLGIYDWFKERDGSGKMRDQTSKGVCPAIRQSCELRTDHPKAQEGDYGMKTSYRVPLMSQIKKERWNGLTVASLFSGCGGSSLGYKMAGMRVLYANEFVPAAQECYVANHENTVMDVRDVRQIKPEEVLKACGLKRGQLDVLDGSPPCASFSMSGNREKDWGKEKSYSDVKQRTDDLFFEFARLLKGIRPRTFVAENVSGLVKGTAKGYFKLILQELKSCGYEVRARVLDAKWLGVPQSRQRLIFVGVRNDLVKKHDVHPVHPKPHETLVTLAEACPWIVRHGTAPSNEKWEQVNHNEYKTTVSSKKKPAPSMAAKPRKGVGSVEAEKGPSLAGYCLDPEWEKLKPGEQSKRYFNMVKAHPKEPCPTITQSAGSNPGTAGVVHPIEKRKFSIGELKRICAFPDDFKVTGTYAQQWERLGRAVPPLMMWEMAKALRDEVLLPIRKARGKKVKMKGTVIPRKVGLLPPPETPAGEPRRPKAGKKRQKREKRAQDPAKAFRALFEKVVSRLCPEDEVALLLSGGIDSLTCGFALEALGKKVVPYTFKVQGLQSRDADSAFDVCKKLGWPLTLVEVPDVVTEDEFLELAGKWRCQKKTQFECTWPLLHFFPHVEQARAVCGVAADAHFGLSKSAILNHSKTKAEFDAYRAKYFSQPSPAGSKQMSQVAEENGFHVEHPFMDPAMFAFFSDYDWQELNKPRDRWMMVDAYKDRFDVTGARRHESMQLIAGVPSLFEKLLDGPLNKRKRTRVLDLCRDYGKRRKK
jgi:DNA (cytosine-5)-methyltransferase 1